MVEASIVSYLHLGILSSPVGTFIWATLVLDIRYDYLLLVGIVFYIEIRVDNRNRRYSDALPRQRIREVVRQRYAGRQGGMCHWLMVVFIDCGP